MPRNDEPHVGTSLPLASEVKIFLWIWLVCECRSRGSWILVSVGSLCVVRQAVERLGRVNTGDWYAWTSNFSISNLFKFTITDFVIYTLFTLNNVGPRRTFFWPEDSGEDTIDCCPTSNRKSSLEALRAAPEITTRSKKPTGLFLSCACFLTRSFFDPWSHNPSILVVLALPWKE